MTLKITLLNFAASSRCTCRTFADAGEVLRKWCESGQGGTVVNYLVVATHKGLAYQGELHLDGNTDTCDLGRHLTAYFRWVTIPQHLRDDGIQFSAAMQGRAAYYLGVVTELMAIESAVVA